MKRKKPDDEPLTVEEFIDQYYRPERLRGDPGRRERIIADRTTDLKEEGRALISRHESVTGNMVILYNPRWRPVSYLRWLVEEHPE